MKALQKSLHLPQRFIFFSSVLMAESSQISFACLSLTYTPTHTNTNTNTLNKVEKN